MSLHNTASSYGSIAKWLHWSTALLFLGHALAAMYHHVVKGDRTLRRMTVD